MARIRSLKPDLWMSPQVMNLSHSARLLFIGLITQADDEGRGLADLRRLKAAIFGGDEVSSTDIRRMLDECSTQRLATFYESENHGLVYALPSWKSHQSIDRPRKSLYPDQPPARDLDEPSTNAREGLEGNGEEGNGMEGSGRARAIEPLERAPVDPNETIELIKARYPAGQFRDSAWLKAAHFVALRLDEGIDAFELVEASAKYCEQQRARGKLGTEFVLSPANFFESNDWRGPFPLPQSKADTRLAGNLNAADEFMRRTGGA